MTPALARPLSARASNGLRVWLFALLTLVGVSLLVALGVWQLQRRAWKIDLIRTVDSRIQAPAHEIPPSALTDPNAHAYEHVEISGTYVAGFDTWIHASTELGAGYWVLSPLRTADGSVVLVNRGFVAMDVARDAVIQESAAQVTGLLRASETSGAWPRRNQPDRDQWYSRDVAAIARKRGLEATRPYFIDAEASAAAEDLHGAVPSGVGARGSVRPVPGLTVVQFRNTHLSYALTWFALALMTAMAGLYVIRGEMLGHPRHP